MSQQESNSYYQPMLEGTKDPVEPQEEEKKPQSLVWILFACIATVCFALSAYILGIISVSGVSAKFLNSFGYLFISICIITVKNFKFCKLRSQLFEDHPEERKTKSTCANFQDTCYYDTENHRYKWLGLFLSVVCGLLNLGGEFSIIFSFQHALDSLMNQGILTSMFTLGSIIVLVGSVILLKEHVRFFEVS